MAREDDDVLCIARESTRVARRRGVRVRQVRNGPIGGRVVDNVRIADLRRVAFDLAARTDLPLAVAHLDAFTRLTRFNLEAFAAELARCTDNDVRAVRSAVLLADERSQSSPESITRVVLVLAGFSVVPQFTIRWRGEFVARVDLALAEHKIAIEYDGAWHAMREQLERDRARLNRLLQAGWRVVHVTAEMLRRPEEIVLAVQAAVLGAQRAS